MAKTILAIGAHADDGLFWCGASLLKAADQGHDVHYLSLTRNVSARQWDEVTALCGEHGIAFSCLGMKSQEIRVDVATKRAVASAVADIEPDLAYVMWPRDLHHDHCVAGELGFIPLRQGHRLHDKPFAIPRTILHYEAGPCHSIGFEPTVFVDVTSVWDRYRALLEHAACDILKHPGIEVKEILAQYRAFQTNRGFDDAARYVEAFRHADPCTLDVF